MSEGTVDLAALERQGKLQVKIERTVLRHKLIMIGNVLLVAWLFSVILVTIWYLVYVQASPSALTTIIAQAFGMPLQQFQQFNAIGIGLWKMAAGLLLLCPGLGLRICGTAMKP